jgi:peptidyl-prolyl cis-trans isomerase A (cyclophilin A)
MPPELHSADSKKGGIWKSNGLKIVIKLLPMMRKTYGLLIAILVLAQACSNPAGTGSAAPAKYRVLFVTSKGNFTVEVTRDWAPKGADRFYELVKSGFYNDARFFRVIRSPRPFMAQFGISGDPAVTAKWTNANLQDDPVKQQNTRGRITFATAGPNTRTTQLFINYADNSRLDSQGFSPFGEVVSGMDVVDQLYADYGEGAPGGNGPDQGRIEKEGNAYLTKDFPNLDYIKTATIVE